MRTTRSVSFSVINAISLILYNFRAQKHPLQCATPVSRFNPLIIIIVKRWISRKAFVARKRASLSLSWATNKAAKKRIEVRRRLISSGFIACMRVLTPCAFFSLLLRVCQLGTQGPTVLQQMCIYSGTPHGTRTRSDFAELGRAQRSRFVAELADL